MYVLKYVEFYTSNADAREAIEFKGAMCAAGKWNFGPITDCEWSSARALCFNIPISKWRALSLLFTAREPQIYRRPIPWCYYTFVCISPVSRESSLEQFILRENRRRRLLSSKPATRHMALPKSLEHPPLTRYLWLYIACIKMLRTKTLREWMWHASSVSGVFLRVHVFLSPVLT